MRKELYRHIFSFGRLSLMTLAILVLSSCSNNSERSLDTITELDTTFDTSSVEESNAEEEPAETKLSFSTPSEALEYMRRSPDSAKYMAGILPGMATDELSYCIKLLNSEHPHFFIVDKAELEIVVFDRYGREEKRVGMACSKNFGTKHKFRDNRTPEGFFSAKKVYNSTDWLYTDDDGKTSDVKGQFGPRFIRLNIPGTSQIGIHGTCAPWSIGHRRSHGCIRVTNDHIMELVQYVDSGMPVIISPGSRDMAVNEEEGYYVPSIATRPGGSKASARKYYDRNKPAENSVDNDTTPSQNEAVPSHENVEHASPDSVAEA